MRFIKLFEDFENLDPSVRDIFDLNHEIKLANGYVLSGPLETSEEAERIALRIDNEINGTDEDAFSTHNKILAEHDDELKELGYTHPEYNVAVVSFSPMGNEATIYCGKEYLEIKAPEKPEDYDEWQEYTEDQSAWWINMVMREIYNLDANYVYSDDGELRTSEEFENAYNNHEF